MYTPLRSVFLACLMTRRHYREYACASDTVGFCAGQGGSGTAVDDKGISIQSKREAAIQRRQQKLAAAAAAMRCRLDFGQS